MLLIPMYHGVGMGKYETPLPLLEAHFATMREYPQVMPGEALGRGLHLCITFDDAREDYYEIVYPLLEKYDLRALLAVPTGLVGTPGYCTWEQLRRVKERTVFASHSHTHANLDEPFDFALEVEGSKKRLEEELDVAVDTFVYPYGRWQADVSSLYRYAMRIGSAYNGGWSPLLYRIPCDGVLNPLAMGKRLHYLLKTLTRLRSIGV